jgi:hypothetical protein
LRAGLEVILFAYRSPDAAFAGEHGHRAVLHGERGHGVSQYLVIELDRPVDVESRDFEPVDGILGHFRLSKLSLWPQVRYLKHRNNQSGFLLARQ